MGRDGATRTRRAAGLAGTLALGVTSLAVVAAPAEASVVSMTRTDVPAMSSDNPKAPDAVPAHTEYILSIRAGAAERNAISVRREADAFVVRDGALATPGAGCAFVDLFTVRCATPLGPGAAFVWRSVGGVELGDGNDSFAGPIDLESALGGTVDAGTGADTVTGVANAIGGPGNDRLVAGAANGGPGDDDLQARDADGGEGRDVLRPLADDVGARLVGGPGDDVIAGASADDLLEGGDGADSLAGGAGNDVLRPGPGADAADGGDGSDTASFAYATAPVTADLAAAAPIDPTGEGDALRNVEALQGGAGDDELRGDDGANRLSGGGGRDVLDGRGGRDDLSGGEADDVLTGGDGGDVLVGGGGADRLKGGAGDDDLAAGDAAAEVDERGFISVGADGAPDTVAGEAGNDVLDVGSRDRADAGRGNDLLIVRGRPRWLGCGGGARDTIDATVLVPRDCELVRVLDLGDAISTRLRLRGTAVYVRVPSFLGPEEPTRVTISLRARGRVLGRGRRIVPDGASRIVRIPIGRAGRRALRASRSVRLDLTAADGTSTERDAIVLRAPR